MSELMWTPSQVGQLTIIQLVCLMNERPPGKGEPITDAQGWKRLADAEAKKEREWHGLEAG